MWVLRIVLEIGEFVSHHLQNKAEVLSQLLGTLVTGI